ncbi:PhoH family protein [uncultured Sutterella sp.]|uniref:PhoH family protein n=1 Tax=uncultured Sutterella sp. TaxID=286133 RepID=UPI0026387718|nr:PhoH family protein [uncultured Sutterella sp.]
MPLPKAPSRPADILEDYGAPAKPQSERTLPKVKNVVALASDDPESAGKPEAARPKKTPRKTLRSGKAPGAPAPVPAEIKAQPAQTPEKKSVKSAKTKKAEAAPAPAKPKAPATLKPAKRSKSATPAEAQAKAAPRKEAAATTTSKPSRTQKDAAAFAGGRSSSPGVQGSLAGRRGRARVADGDPRLFVLDTNVLMHDPLSLFRFAEHDVFLPMTTLEELDNHKKGLTDVARNARSVSRTLDALIEANDGRITEGVPLSLLGNTEAKGLLWFETKPLQEELPGELDLSKGDNRILSTVEGVRKAFPKRAVVLVSKDINMRIKATTLGIPAEDYLSDKVLDDTDMLYSGKLMLEPGFWDKASPTLRSWQDHGSTFYEFEADDPSRFIVNECLWIDGDENFMGLVTAVHGQKVTFRLMKDYRAKSRTRVWGINARNREQNMAINLLMDPEIDFVTILGQAGTGKTLMTLAAALTQTIDERRFSEIIMTRATVSVGEDIGFLPGTEEEKMAPWMGALEDNLEVLHASDTGGEWGRQATMDLIRSRIRVKSMSFMRGRTFLQKFVIIDEAQNLSPKQMKTLITRAGPGTKIVCLGNIAQIDTPYLTEGSSGLTYVVERFQGWEHAATITLTRGERSRLAEFAAEAL